MIKTQAQERREEGDDESKSIVCWNKDTQAQCLRVELSSAIFVFPYAHLLSAKLARVENRDVLEVSLSSHAIRVSGRNLREVLLALQKFAVEWVKEVPPRYHRLVAREAVLIEAIEVQERSEQETSLEG